MMQRVHITLPPEEYEWVTALAKTEDRSISAQFSRIIRSAKRTKEETEITQLKNEYNAILAGVVAGDENVIADKITKLGGDLSP